MIRFLRSQRRIFGTRRGLRLFTANALAAFGGISALIQFVGQLFPETLPGPGVVTLLAVGLCVVWGQARAWPPGLVWQEFHHPDMVVTIEAGDVFDRPGQLVVGFCDTFDTAVEGDGVVNGSSVQGQLLSRRYDGDPRRLDRELSSALRTTNPISRERRNEKRRGKLERYPVGTVAVLGKPPHIVFAVAYSRLGNDFVARSSAEELWFSLNRLWDAVYERGEQGRVVMPLIGTGLSRITSLSREDILRLILLSFVTRSRERRVCRELQIIVRPAELERIDTAEVEDFLRMLGAQPARA